MRGHRHLRQHRLRRFQRSPIHATSSPAPTDAAPTGPGAARGRRWLPAGWLAALLALAPGSAYISLSEAASPLFGWTADRAHVAVDESTPPAVILPDRVRPPAEPSRAAAPASVRVTLGKGDTLALVLDRANVPYRQAHAAIEALRPVYNPRHLRAGQELALTLAPGNGSQAVLIGLELSARFDQNAGITLYPDGDYRAFTAPKHLNKLPARSAGVIRSSLFSDGLEAGVPAATMADFIRLFSFDVDFERDVHPDDRFELVFERYIDGDGNIVHAGNLLYAGLTVAGRERGYYRFDGGDGDDAFYDAQGNGIRKALLRTPVDGARKSSGFGMRRHPISGYNKMHKGVDFAAPRGTPIRAAGDGVISFAGRKGGYGNYLSVRHNGEYETAYAHMHGFAKGMRRGARVKQGQIIGYVGSTGRSTGPHLHYEVLVKGKHINPATLRLPSGKKLQARDLKRFRQQIGVIDALRNRGTDGDTLVAARPD